MGIKKARRRAPPKPIIPFFSYINKLYHPISTLPTVKKGLLFISLILLGAIRVAAQPVIQLTADAPYQRITRQCGWFVDSSARLTLPEIIQPPIQSRFQLARHEMGAYGLTDAAIWIQGNVSYTGTDKVYLLIEFANIDSVTLYYYDKEVLKTVQAGSLTPLATKPINIPGFIFELPAPANGSQEFWLRVRTGNALIVPLSMATSGGLPRSMAGMYIIALLYAGVVLALFFYNLSLYGWIRDPSYLYYLGYLFFLAVFIFLYLCGFHVYLGQTLSTFVNQYAGIGSVAAGYMFMIQFAILFLKGKEYAPALARILRILGWLLWIPVICCILGWRHALIRIQEIVSLLVPILFIWMAIRAWGRNYKPAIYFMIAWTFLLVSIVLFAITNMGVLPYGGWTFDILPVGSAIEVILLSLALGYRYSLLKNEQKKVLESKVNERTKELQEALEQLNESNQAKDKLLNIIAHDIRSPLNNLFGYLELAEKKVMAAGQIQQFIQVLRRNISHIAKSMNNLLNWSLTQRNHIETNPSRIPLSPITRQILDTYRFSAEEKGVVLKKNMPEELVVVADSHQLELILRNLLDNAIKFTPEGGAITIGCRPRAEQVVVYVSDTGSGMLQEEADRLLHKNSLHSASNTVPEKATGLGLQLCKEFVASNGGILQVRSAPGEGTEFYFSLPGSVEL